MSHVRSERPRPKFEEAMLARKEDRQPVFRD